MPRPQRHDEGVAFLPVEGLAVDQRRAAAAEGVVDAGAGVERFRWLRRCECGRGVVGSNSRVTNGLSDRFPKP